ncbi:MAG: 6,7-dimethyl-8-ribityllumazine synthase [Deltaproteobacteria bacterium]|nr:6,7-dimethyl-8-ribityllumazine synthase [Deltaproteobacteria bacterium]
MPNTFEGNLSAKGLKFAVVVSRSNEFIGEKLLGGALDTLKRSGAGEGDIDVVKVPGSFEMPVAAKALAEKKAYDAIVCVGAVIRGSTPHFDYIAGEAAKGIARVAVEYGLPVSFGVITADTIEQAIERAGTKSGNKGRDAALTAIEMANLLKTLRKNK